MSIAYRPVHWLPAVLVWGFALGFASLAEVVTSFSTRAGDGAGRFLGRVTALVDEAVVRRTEQVAKPKPRVPRAWLIPVRDYRGAGARYVAERAQARGWQLRPSDVRKEVSLYWPHSSTLQD